MKKSTRNHWNSYWGGKKDIHDVYSNTDRVIHNLSRVTDVKGKLVLEVGAGSGRDSFTLVGKGATVLQLDYAEQALKVITALSKEEQIPVQPLCGDAFSLPFKDNSIDIVFHQGLLEHFREADAKKLLEENVRVLKKGGLLLVDVPQRWHPYTVLKHVLIGLNAWFAGWEREFSIGELRTIFNGLDLENVLEYGEWFCPSLGYRVGREILWRAGIHLPLYPKLPVLSGIREKIRLRLRDGKIPVYTGMEVGIIGRKN